jgi:hypothetical protein
VYGKTCQQDPQIHEEIIMSDTKANVKQVKEFFEADGGSRVSMQELKALKDAGGYDAIAEGIGNGSLTY